LRQDNIGPRQPELALGQRQLNQAIRDPCQTAEPTGQIALAEKTSHRKPFSNLFNC
jgi:hypothetical protein